MLPGSKSPVIDTELLWLLLRTASLVEQSTLSVPHRNVFFELNVTFCAAIFLGTVNENSVTVFPTLLHAPDKPLLGHNDHRVVMSLSVLLTAFGGTVCGAEAVNKSYPNFFDDLQNLGIEVITRE